MMETPVYMLSFGSITFRLLPDIPTTDALICSGKRVYLFRDGKLQSFLYVSEVTGATVQRKKNSLIEE